MCNALGEIPYTFSDQNYANFPTNILDLLLKFVRFQELSSSVFKQRLFGAV